MIKIKGEGTSLDWQIINSIKNVSLKNIEFKNIAFECETITDASGNLFEKRKKGKWIEENDGWDGIFWRCSECNEPFYLVDGTPVDNEYHYCPNCGADMRGEQDGKST